MDGMKCLYAPPPMKDGAADAFRFCAANELSSRQTSSSDCAFGRSKSGKRTAAGIS